MLYPSITELNVECTQLQFYNENSCFHVLCLCLSVYNKLDIMLSMWADPQQ